MLYLKPQKSYNRALKTYSMQSNKCVIIILLCLGVCLSVCLSISVCVCVCVMAGEDSAPSRDWFHVWNYWLLPVRSETRPRLAGKVGYNKKILVAKCTLFWKLGHLPFITSALNTTSYKFGCRTILVAFIALSKFKYQYIGECGITVGKRGEMDSNLLTDSNWLKVNPFISCWTGYCMSFFHLYMYVWQ